MNKRIIHILATDRFDGNRTVPVYYLTDSSPVLDTRSGGFRTLKRAVEDAGANGYTHYVWRDQTKKIPSELVVPMSWA
jgi:hypothetical protein